MYPQTYIATNLSPHKTPYKVTSYALWSSGGGRASPAYPGSKCLRRTAVPGIPRAATTKSIDGLTRPAGRDVRPPAPRLSRGRDDVEAVAGQARVVHVAKSRAIISQRELELELDGATESAILPGVLRIHDPGFGLQTDAAEDGFVLAVLECV